MSTFFGDVTKTRNGKRERGNQEWENGKLGNWEIGNEVTVPE